MSKEKAKKDAIDNTGKKVKVDFDTPVKTKNGVHYLLSPAEQAEFDARIAQYQSEAPNRAKRIKLDQLNKYYISEDIRQVTYGNGLVIVNDKAKNGTTQLRARVKDNGDITTCEWYFDNGAVQTLDVDGIVALNKLVIDKDQQLRRLKKAHEDAINSLTVEADILSYDITQNINGESWT